MHINALAETINGLYKTERIHRKAPWKSKAAVELATLEWVFWFNHQRPHQTLKMKTPAEAYALAACPEQKGTGHYTILYISKLLLLNLSFYDSHKSRVGIIFYRNVTVF